MSTHYIACDLGAGSGRVMLGTFNKGILTLEEIHRFSNRTVRLGDSIRWNLLRTFAELKKGLKKVAAREVPVASLSVDSWGVDYVWSGFGQPMLAPAYIYRDHRTDAMFEKALATVGRDKIFFETGIQMMSLNTLYQLMADKAVSPELLKHADGFLNIADFFHFLFSGVRRAEESIASTTQLYSPTTRTWAAELIRAFDFPPGIFPELVPSGTRLGPITSDIEEETGLKGTWVVASCSHDTAAAVAAVPTDGGSDWAFLSCGTWSLIGVELDEPLINAASQAANYTNEGGLGGTTRFLKNIVGLWLLQESCREWEHRGTRWTYAELDQLAETSEPLRTLIDPNDPRFLKPGDMPDKIAAFASETGQPVPATPGEFTRTILESLSLSYRHALETIEELTGRTINTLHIVGGGCQSKFFNQFIANAIKRRVVAGPVEATAIGNILVQAIANGQLASRQDLRATVKKSIPIEEFRPAGDPAWDAAYDRFLSIKNR